MVESEPDLRQGPAALRDDERALSLTALRRKYLWPAVSDFLSNFSDATRDRFVERYDCISVAELLAETGASRAAAELLLGVSWDFVGEPPLQRSALDFISYLATISRSGQRYSIEGGNDLLPRAMANELGDSIQYGVKVVELRSTETAVDVTLACDQTYRVVQANRVICALPIAALRRIRIRPAVSQAKRRVIEELGSSSALSCAIQVRLEASELQQCSLAFSDLPIGMMWQGPSAHCGRAVLQGVATGAEARRLLNANAEQKNRVIARNFGELFPAMEGNIEGVSCKCWDEEHSGGLAYFKPGEIGRLQHATATAEGRLHFAGEYTASLPLHGMAQGAVESGIKAAAEVKKLLAR